MKTTISCFFAVGICFLATACVTNGEPKAHVDACHNSDGTMVESAACQQAHDEIVKERDDRALRNRARAERSMDGPDRQSR